MNFELVRNFNQDEQIALLKLLVKVAGSDGKIDSNEQKTLKEYLSHNNLKISKDFVKKSLNEDVEIIVSNFSNKINLNRAFTIISEFAKLHGINPEHEAIILNQIKSISEAKKKEIKFNLIDFLKTFVLEFAFLWGKEDISPNLRKVLAIVFTLIACILGSFWTSGYLFWKSSDFVMPETSHVISGLLIFGALCCRGYLPIPNKIRNIIFSCANLYMFSIITMYILGRGSLEKSTTFLIFGGLVLLLWLGIKEVLGFAFIGFFLLLVYKLIRIDASMAWRAFPFVITAFMGISFQSSNFFDNFTKVSSSFFKKPEIDKELVKESLQIAGQKTVNATKKAIATGTQVAKMSAGGI